MTQAGDLDEHDNKEKTIEIVRAAYGWTLTDEGRVCGLVAGDMGYAATSIVIDRESLDAWAEFNYRPAAISTSPAVADGGWQPLDRLTGQNCSVCGCPQFDSPHGVTCSHGHGGADGVDPPESDPPDFDAPSQQQPATPGQDGEGR